MQLLDLIDLTNNLYYADSSSWRVIQSTQNELLTVIRPTIDIKKIDFQSINKLINHYKSKNNSPATINNKLAYLSKILNYAYKNNLIQNKPYIPTMKVIQSKEKYLTPEEKIKMLQWCRHNNQKELLKILLIGLYTGLRINNILSLNNSMYDNGKLYIYDKKTNKNFVIPVSNKIKYIVTTLEGFSMNYQQCYYIFNLMKKELQLDTAITIHTLRHTFCSDLINKNIDISIIQALANHKRITTTMRYTHLNTSRLEEAIASL